MKKQSPPFVYFFILALGFLAAGWGSYCFTDGSCDESIVRAPAAVPLVQQTAEQTTSEYNRYQKRGSEIIVEAIE